MTKGERNKFRDNDWALFTKDVLEVSQKKIIQTAKGPEPSYSFRPGGEGMAFDSETNVCLYLHGEYCLMLFNKPDYTKPGSYKSYIF